MRIRFSLMQGMTTVLIVALLFALGTLYSDQQQKQKREQKLLGFAEWYEGNHPIADIPSRYHDLFPGSRIKDGVAFIPLNDADTILELLNADAKAFRIRGRQCVYCSLYVRRKTNLGEVPIYSTQFDLRQPGNHNNSRRSESFLVVNLPQGIAGKPTNSPAVRPGALSMVWKDKYNGQLQRFAFDLSPHLPDWILSDPQTTLKTTHTAGLFIDGTIHHDSQVITSWEYHHPAHETISLMVVGSLENQKQP